MYYITPKNSETGKKIQQILIEASRSQLQISNYLKLLGANHDKWISTGLYNTGFQSAYFNEIPDLSKWKYIKKTNSYIPRTDTHEGLKIYLTLQQINTITKKDFCEIFGATNKVSMSQCFFSIYPDVKFYGFNMNIRFLEKPFPEDCTEITYAKYLELFNSK